VNYFILVCLVLLLSYLLLAALQLWVLFRYRDSKMDEPAEWPAISVLVAARNEEKSLGACLEALCALDYPKERLQILVGNDQSTDHTGIIAGDFQKTFPWVKVIEIVDDDSGLKAKARVMAQLDKHATGDYYLVTDADVRVKPGWAKFLVRHMTEETGVASGTTMVSGKSRWSRLQGIDWAYFMGLLNIISYSGVPATAVGNNMVVRKKAYWDTGGYSAIKFSITEDYKLYSEICKHGWKWNNIMTPEVLAYSDSTSGFFPLLHQRKRWLSGGLELPWYWWIMFGIFGLYYFLVPVLFMFEPILASVIFVLKMAMQITQINKIYGLLGEKRPGFLLQLWYEAYLFLVTVSTAIFFLLPIPTIWKGRKYS